MFSGPKILFVTLCRSILYILGIFLLLFINLNSKSPAAPLLNILTVFTLLILISLFFSLVRILKSIREKKATIVSYILYPLCILLALLNAFVFKSNHASTSTLITAGLTILVTINLVIQTFRMRKSYISIYYRVVAVTVFIIPFNKMFFPMIFGLLYKLPNQEQAFINAMETLSIINLVLFLTVPVAIIFMVGKLKRLMVSPAQSSNQ